MDSADTMRIIYGDGTLGLTGAHFHYQFSYETGSLESLQVDGKEWLYRPIYPTYWRATTDNDRGNGFSYRSAQWLGADQFPKVIDTDLEIDGKHIDQLPTAPYNNHHTNHETVREVACTFSYQTATTPATQTIVKYTVTVDGQIKVQAYFAGRKGLPELPVFGLRLITPTVADGFAYDGLSGETYPDRMAGGISGHYEVQGTPLTPYLVPQEMGIHMQTKLLTITRSTTLNNADKDEKPFYLSLLADEQPFNFSLWPYTSEELENATHIEELPPLRRSVLVIAGAVRGVGGIDSWGSDVDTQYHFSGEADHQFSFIIQPGRIH